MKCTLCSQEMEEGIMDDGYWVQRTGMFKNAQNLGKKIRSGKNGTSDSVPLQVMRQNRFKAS